MRELSSEAQAMLDLARDGHDPSEHDRRRLNRAMIARLGAVAVVSSSATLASGVSAAGTSVAVSALAAVKTVAAVVVAGGVSAALLWQVSDVGVDAQRKQRAPIVQTAASSLARPVLSAPAVEGVAVGTPLASSSARPEARTLPEARKRAPRSVASNALGLSQQVRVLARARAALREGRAAEALALLDESAAVFQRGSLREEFLAARVSCLRELGRAAEASDAARDFASEMPSSPLVPKATRQRSQQP